MEGSGILSECLTYFLHRFVFYVLLEKLRRLAKTERAGLLMKTANQIFGQVDDRVEDQVWDQT